MKSITLPVMLMILFTSHSLMAQTKDSYLIKSMHQKTAAWIMLGGGFSLVVAGGMLEFANIVDFVDGYNNGRFVTGRIMVITGGAAMLGSIPLFIAGSQNKHKDMDLSFMNQPMPSLVKNLTGNKSIPSIGLRLKL